MILTDKQRDDLNLAILEYLEKNGYGTAAEAFQAEIHVQRPPSQING